MYSISLQIDFELFTISVYLNKCTCIQFFLNRKSVCTDYGYSICNFILFLFFCNSTLSLVLHIGTENVCVILFFFLFFYFFLFLAVVSMILTAITIKLTHFLLPQALCFYLSFIILVLFLFPLLLFTHTKFIK